MTSLTLATLRQAADSFVRTQGGAPVAGADLGPFLGDRRWWRGALEAGALREEGGALRLTEEGARELAGVKPAPVIVTREQARKAESRRVLGEHAPSPFVRVDITPEMYTVAKAKRDVRAIYRGRAARILSRALRTWALAHLGEELAPRIEISRYIRGRVRYWMTGAIEGWIVVVGSAGRSNDCGCRVGCEVYLTDKGLEVLREAQALIEAGEAAVRSLHDPRNVHYLCCGHLRGPADLNHAPTCPAMEAA